jgi:Putative prokaryotic signal transducing protein
MREANLVIVQAFSDQWEAEMAKSLLEAAGIDSVIQADSVGGNRPDIAFHTGGYRVVVREKYAAAAHTILKPPTSEA